jgi:hypothetical protein
VINRIFRVFRLDATVFKEIAEDQGAMTQAAIIVVVVFLISALGSAIGAAIAGTGNAIVTFFSTFILGILVSWILWAVLTYFIGTMLFKGRSSIPEMMRVLGYANAPNLLGIFAIIPCVGWIAALVGGVDGIRYRQGPCHCFHRLDHSHRHQLRHRSPIGRYIEG